MTEARAPGTVQSYALSLLRGDEVAVPSPFAWADFLAFAAQQQVLASLAGLLEAEEHCPIQPLLAFYRAQARSAADQHYQALLQTSTVLEGAGIEVVALKGAAFLVEGLRLRSMVDLDLLVDPSQLTAACALLIGCGHGSDPNHDAIHAQHAPPLFTPAGVMIEMHSEVAGGRVRNPLPTELIFARHRRHSSDHAALRVPCPEHRIVHLITHAMLSNKGMRLSQVHLRDLMDLREIAARHAIDWEAVRSLFAAAGYLRPLCAFLTAAHLLLGPRLAFPDWALTEKSWARRAVACLFDPSRHRWRRYIGQFLCDVEAFGTSPVYRQHAARSLHPARWPGHLRRYISLR